MSFYEKSYILKALQQMKLVRTKYWHTQEEMAGKRVFPKRRWFKLKKTTKIELDVSGHPVRAVCKQLGFALCQGRNLLEVMRPLPNAW